MLASILITAVSFVLLCYWFRYSCLLLLRNRLEQAAPTQDHRFSYAQVREQVETAADLDPLRLSLERDYRIVTYLLQHTAGLGTQTSLEDRLLQLDYRLMHHWYGLTHSAAPKLARRALSEMAEIVACLAQKMAPAGVQSQS